MRETGTPFGSALEALAGADPDRPAVTCEGRTVSREELLAGVRAVAAELLARGVRRGDVVSIGLPNCIELVQALFATWWIGATPAPFSHRLPAAERRQILELASPVLVVGEAGAEGTDFTVDQMTTADRADRDPGPALVSPVWKIITSGGSTGRPKLIVSSKAAVAEDASTAAKLRGLPYGGGVLMPAPLSHSAPSSIPVNSLLRGVTSCF